VISSIFDFTKYILLFIVDGTSDDLDIPIKEVFLDSEYVKNHNLCSINSINWARIMVQVGRYYLFWYQILLFILLFQTVHYFYCYFQCRLSPGYPVNIIVPTGAAGNIACKYSTYPSFIYSWSISLIWNMNSSVWAAQGKGTRYNIKATLD
jgi:threonine synthase